MNIILTSALSGIILMFSGFFFKDKRHLNLLSVLLFVAMIVSAVFQLKGCEILAGKYPNMIETDPYRISFFMILCVVGIYYVLVNRYNFSKPGSQVSDYLALIFISFTGIAVLASFNNLILMFLGIEILSIPLYALAGSAKHRMRSTEAAVKYFLMGAFSTGIMLMGITLIYGASGSFLLENITAYAFDFQSIYYLGWVLLILSLCFKVSVAPLHFWAPDVYDGSPTVFSSYMITIVKGAAFMTFITVMSAFKITSEIVSNNYQYLLSFIIILTLILGNFSALKQTSVKRMLAYSSVVQAGFMMFALFEINEASKNALLFYTISYGLASVVLFYALTKVKNDYKDFNGLSQRAPVLAFASTIALLSLSGIPFTSGFLAKFMILSSAMGDPSNLILVIAALVLAVLSIYYYIKVIIAMYFRSSKEKTIKLSFTTQLLLIAGTVLTIALGVYPNLLWMALNCLAK
ncbi:NADH-quinone oxidoreductase subunit N [Moheibacter sediminis]|uniref:NADH-quinone oxidoreductase subunit N n=1 Tax=Moheibacter sediminis TaxID=1434700 RepID=A0A1W2BEP8_9FLAO|nr:NADH-quinone oxidoreductase subunit N [Moheibacter sediminis]SMC71389.1 NADH dehydrogenase subunit N [Moheibacter sediminis]